MDHIDGLGPNGPRGFDPTNWQALCHPHHYLKTLRYDGGFGNPKLPASERPPGWTGLGDDGWSNRGGRGVNENGEKLS